MTPKKRLKPASFAILTMAEIKAAADGFNSGEVNVYDALEAIALAVEAYRAVAAPRRTCA